MMNEWVMEVDEGEGKDIIQRKIKIDGEIWNI